MTAYPIAGVSIGLFYVMIPVSVNRETIEETSSIHVRLVEP